MSKFDFNNSVYASFFKSGEGQAILRDFIDRSGLINVNLGWWRTQFSVDPNITPTDASGVASYRIDTSVQKPTGMLDMRAPLGKSHPYKKEGFAFYTGTIPDFTSDTIAETAMEREYKEQYFAQFGNDSKFVQAYAKYVQELIDAKDQTINYMGAQLESTGAINYDKGRGIQGIQAKAPIPAENKVTAGEKAWTAQDCKILSQMAIIEDQFRQRTGFEGAMTWLISNDMYEKVFLKNAEVKEWVNYMRNLNTNSPQTAPEIPIILDDMFFNAVSKFPGLSPIEIVKEEEHDKNWAGTTTVHGWKEGVAVLRPAGFAGMIKHTTILDQKLADKYGNSIVSQNFVSVDGFSMIHNATMVDGEYMSWNTRLLVAAIPTLYEFPEHVIVDTTKANA